MEARRDWLTGLPHREALQRILRNSDRQVSLGVIDFELQASSGATSQLRSKLNLRDFAHALRLELRGDMQAFRRDGYRLAVLVPVGTETPLDTFVSFNAPRDAGLVKA